MKLVVGLGNPGPKYQGTRHNVGFAVLARLSGRHQAGKPRLQFDAECAELRIAGEKVLLAAPQSYMNASGRPVRRLMDFYGVSPDELLVICDDLNLDVGRLRLRRSGSSGGQKGLQDVIRHVGEDFARLRIGIGRPPPNRDAVNYVLSRFRGEGELAEIEQAVELAGDAVETWVREGVDSAMNRFNAPPTDEPGESPRSCKSD